MSLRQEKSVQSTFFSEVIIQRGVGDHIARVRACKRAPESPRRKPRVSIRRYWMLVRKGTEGSSTTFWAKSRMRAGLCWCGGQYNAAIVIRCMDVFSSRSAGIKDECPLMVRVFISRSARLRCALMVPLQMGVELQLPAKHEWPATYWYWDYVMTTKLITESNLREAKEQLEAIKTQMEVGHHTFL